MKRYPVPFPIPRRGLVPAPLALALLFGGCATAPAPPPETEAAFQAVRAVAATPRGYPRFSDIPSLPVDARPLAAWGRAARDVMAAGDALTRDSAETTWTLGGSEAFAADARLDAGPPAPTVSATVGAESFAREVRKRATPPPPPVR